MSARLDFFTLDLWQGTVSVPWSSREELLDEIGHLPGAESAVRSFDAVGASGPVRLGRPDKELVANAIGTWASEVGEEELPPGIWALRCALVDDLAALPE
jgi:hypothetical protein